MGAGFFTIRDHFGKTARFDPARLSVVRSFPQQDGTTCIDLHLDRSASADISLRFRGGTAARREVMLVNRLAKRGIDVISPGIPLGRPGQRYTFTAAAIDNIDARPLHGTNLRINSLAFMVDGATHRQAEHMTAAKKEWCMATSCSAAPFRTGSGFFAFRPARVWKYEASDGLLTLHFSAPCSGNTAVAHLPGIENEGRALSALMPQARAVSPQERDWLRRDPEAFWQILEAERSGRPVPLPPLRFDKLIFLQKGR